MLGTKAFVSQSLHRSLKRHQTLRVKRQSRRHRVAAEPCNETGNGSVYIGERITFDLGMELYAHLQTLSLGFFEQRRVGELVSRLSRDA